MADDNLPPEAYIEALTARAIEAKLDHVLAHIPHLRDLTFERQTFLISPSISRRKLLLGHLNGCSIFAYSNGQIYMATAPPRPLENGTPFDMVEPFSWVRDEVGAEWDIRKWGMPLVRVYFQYLSMAKGRKSPLGGAPDLKDVINALEYIGQSEGFQRKMEEVNRAREDALPAEMNASEVESQLPAVPITPPTLAMLRENIKAELLAQLPALSSLTIESYEGPGYLPAYLLVGTYTNRREKVSDAPTYLYLRFTGKARAPLCIELQAVQEFDNSDKIVLHGLNYSQVEDGKIKMLDVLRGTNNQPELFTLAKYCFLLAAEKDMFESDKLTANDHLVSLLERVCRRRAGMIQDGKAKRRSTLGPMGDEDKENKFELFQDEEDVKPERARKRVLSRKRHLSEVSQSSVEIEGKHAEGITFPISKGKLAKKGAMRREPFILSDDVDTIEDTASRQPQSTLTKLGDSQQVPLSTILPQDDENTNGATPELTLKSTSPDQGRDTPSTETTCYEQPQETCTNVIDTLITRSEQLGTQIDTLDTENRSLQRRMLVLEANKRGLQERISRIHDEAVPLRAEKKYVHDQLRGLAM